MNEKLSKQIKDFRENLNQKQKDCLQKYDIACLEDCADIVLRLEDLK